jgi:hypothetical protein
MEKPCGVKEKLIVDYWLLDFQDIVGNDLECEAVFRIGIKMDDFGVPKLTSVHYKEFAAEDSFNNVKVYVVRNNTSWTSHYGCELLDMSLDTSRYGLLLLSHLPEIVKVKPAFKDLITSDSFFFVNHDDHTDLIETTKLKMVDQVGDPNMIYDTVLNVTLADLFAVFSLPRFDSTSWEEDIYSRKHFLNIIESYPRDARTGYWYLHCSLQVTLPGPLFAALRKKYPGFVHFNTNVYRIKFYRANDWLFWCVFVGSTIVTLPPFSSPSTFVNILISAIVQAITEEGEDDLAEIAYEIN